DFQHFLHHRQFLADLVHDRTDKIESRLQDAREAAEALDRPFATLGHRLDGCEDEDETEKENCARENTHGRSRLPIRYAASLQHALLTVSETGVLAVIALAVRVED